MHPQHSLWLKHHVAPSPPVLNISLESQIPSPGQGETLQACDDELVLPQPSDPVVTITPGTPQLAEQLLLEYVQHGVQHPVESVLGPAHGAPPY